MKEKYYIMDESDRPYEGDENPFLHSEEDEKFDKMMAERFHLEPREQILKDGVMDLAITA